ncbi:heme peroxidase family protein [soil metagenome]
MAAHHGSGPFVIAFREGKELRFIVFDDVGAMSIEDARFDPETNRIVFKVPHSAFGLSKPAIPYERFFLLAHPDNIPTADSLSELAAAIATASIPDETGDSDIPAAFTYLGQFVMHDMTYATGDPAKPKSLRSAALDLDSIFDPPPKDLKIAPGKFMTAPLQLGCTVLGGYRPELPEDLPRDITGIACVGDNRNDDILPLAQFHTAIMLFHNAVAALEWGGAEPRDATALHVQSVVLHDYLKLLIDPAVYDDVIANGRAVIAPKGDVATPLDTYFIPLEFAFACGRFGHSLIRSNYPGWNRYNTGSPDAFWNNTASSSEPHPFRGTTPPPKFVTRLPRLWITDWHALLDFSDGQFGQGRPGAAKPIMAAPINTRLAHRLTEIPTPAIPAKIGRAGDIGSSHNLAERTLLRGNLLAFKSGQEIAQAVLDILKLSKVKRPLFEILTDKEIRQDEHPDILAALSKPAAPNGRTLLEATPLWFYVLKEAERRQDGKRLGPLASRIVMETLHAAIQAARPSIINDQQKVDWKPDARLHGTYTDYFRLADLIRFAGLADRPT